MFYPNRPLEIGGKYRAEVSHFLSLNKFYVRLCDKKSETIEDELTGLLRTHQRNIETGDVTYEQVWDDTTAVVVFDGKRMERAEIYRNATQSRKKVFLVDQGRMELIHNRNIFPSNSNLLRLPALAITCSTIQVQGAQMEQLITGKLKIRVVGKWDGSWVTDVETSEGDSLLLKVLELNSKLPHLRTVPGSGAYPRDDFSGWTGFKIPIRILEVLPCPELVVEINSEAAEYVAKTIGDMLERRSKEQLDTGKSCLVIHGGKYVRGETMECNPDGTYVVQLVDYCKYVVVASNTIMELPEELSRVPPTGVKVLIADLVGAVLTSDQMKDLKNYLDRQILYGTILSTTYIRNNIKRVVITVAFPQCKGDFKGLSISDILRTPPLNLKKVSSDEEEIISSSEAWSFIYPSAPEGPCTVTLLEDHLAVIVEDGLEGFTYEMNRFYEAYYNMTTPMKPGNYTVVIDQEGDWRRGIILDAQDDKANVKLIDVGDVITVGRDKMRDLLRYFGRSRQYCREVNVTRSLDRSVIDNFCTESVYVSFVGGFVTLKKIGGDVLGPLELM